MEENCEFVCGWVGVFGCIQTADLPAQFWIAAYIWCSWISVSVYSRMHLIPIRTDSNVKKDIIPKVVTYMFALSCLFWTHFCVAVTFDLWWTEMSSQIKAGIWVCCILRLQPCPLVSNKDHHSSNTTLFRYNLHAGNMPLESDLLLQFMQIRTSHYFQDLCFYINKSEDLLVNLFGLYFESADLKENKLFVTPAEIRMC